MGKTFKRNNPRKGGKNKLSKSKSSKPGMTKLNDLDGMIKGINDFYKDNKVLCHKVFTESKEVTVFRDILLGKKQTKNRSGGGSSGNNSLNPIHGPPNLHLRDLDSETIINMIVVFIGFIVMITLCIGHCLWEISVAIRRPAPGKLRINERPDGPAIIETNRDNEARIERERIRRRRELYRDITGCFDVIINMMLND